MTPPGQCRLTALIPCIQDSNSLYDFAVRIMFKLHVNLPHDLLEGHRQRFNAIFIQLQSFYKQSNDLQYFVNLITVPKLPPNIPNFTSQGDFGNYVPPTVIVPIVEPAEIEKEVPIEKEMDEPLYNAELVDTSSEASNSNSSPKMMDGHFEQLLRDRDDLIQHLQMEIKRMG